jgi:hypothetical protein
MINYSYRQLGPSYSDRSIADFQSHKSIENDLGHGVKCAAARRPDGPVGPGGRRPAGGDRHAGAPVVRALHHLAALSTGLMPCAMTILPVDDHTHGVPCFRYCQWSSNNPQLEVRMNSWTTSWR